MRKTLIERVFSFIIERRRAVVIIFTVLTVLCAAVSLAVPVNYNLMDYLPAEARSTAALEIMGAEFEEALPNASVMLNGVTAAQVLKFKGLLEEIPGVSGVTWLDDVADVKIPLEMIGKGILESYYKDGHALISLTVKDGNEVDVIDRIYELAGEDGAVSGAAVDRAVAQVMAGSETMGAMFIAVPLIIIVLLVSTGSWLEPVLFLCAIGVSVLINMGTNIFLGEVSFLTKSISPILQLAVSLDYAIFLLRSFDGFRRETRKAQNAMLMAMKRALPAVAASAATTLFGFMALMFMDFRVGADLGASLAKGILISFVSVMVFLPALTLFCHKWIDKTKHREILPEFKNVGKGLSRLGRPVLILVAIVIVPCYLAQGLNNFTYGSGSLSLEASRSGRDAAAIEEVFGASVPVVLLLPKGDPAREAMLCAELEEINHVTGVVAYVTMAGVAVPPEYVGEAIAGRFYSENYCRIIVYTDTEDEGADAFETAENIQAAAAKYYGDAALACGSSVNTYDMKNVVEADNKRVNIIAMAAIFLVLLVTFRSAVLPFLLIVTIETAIWSNLSIPYFMDTPLVYIGYLVINTVQLGATVDYAILLTDHYMAARKKMQKTAATVKALGETFGSILISGTTLTLAGTVLCVTSSNQIVSSMGLLLARGTIFSMAMVVCFLPAALVLFDKAIEKTTYKAGFFKTHL